MNLKKQILAIGLVIALFAVFNLSMYQLLTRRLSNNFSDATRAQMIDVGNYLPHQEDSELPKIESSLKLTDNLPVLDGAAALVPVYAAVIDNVYPKGCVTYEGGEFSDDNFYGENFAEDIVQINNLYELLVKEIANKSTKKAYKELYNKNYLLGIQEKDEKFKKEKNRVNLNTATLINSNYWRIEGIKNIYTDFTE